MELIKQLISRNALFVINHSGGKDSQAMTIFLSKIIPLDQLVIVHADLPEVDWEGSVEHINQTSFGIPVYTCRARKTFFEMVEHRKMFPSPKYRQCTSDLKRGPIEKQIRSIIKQRGSKIIVNCMGMRAQESANRKKLIVFKQNKQNTIKDRDWFDWLPIHSMTTREVFETIKESGQKPFWTYSEGMSRKSCAFCIMANNNDLKIAAMLRPELAKKYIDAEERLGFTLKMDKTPLKQIIAE